MKLQVLIVDDEPLARDGIRARLHHDPEVEIVGECANGRDAVLAIKSGAPDLVFLDIQMPLLDGFGVIERIGSSHMPVVIFVTAYDDFALQAFEARALDYILKPINDLRFHSALARAKTQIDRLRASSYRDQLTCLLQELKTERHANIQKQGYIDRISVKSKDRIVILDIRDVESIESMDNYVELNIGEKSYVLRETMNRLESKLDPSTFLRVRRSTIVNIQHIKELRPLFNREYLIVMVTGSRIQSSRRYRKNLDVILPR